jgi:hypothetical protein
MRTRTELTLENAFSDPLVRSLMAADKVDAAGLQTMLAGIARQITPRISSAKRFSPVTNLSRAIDSMCGCAA